MFKRLFAFHKYDYALQHFDWDTQTRTPWFRLPTDAHPALSAEQLGAHLEQRISIAAYAAKRTCVIDGEYRRRAMTKHLLIDLDYQGSDDDLRIRADTVRRALGAPTFVQMTPGGGVHMVYLFARKVRLLKLRGPGGNAGSVIRLLKEQGLTESRGTMEVFPADKSWKAAENGCRLPFGPGSYLLDPRTLEIEDGSRCGINALRCISERLASGELEYIDVKAWHARAAKLPRIPRETTRVIANAFRYAKPFLEHGLRRFGQRRRAMVALAYYWWWQGESESNAVTATHHWMRTRHNNWSRTWNEAIDKQPVLDECEEIVRALYRMQRLRVATNTGDLPFVTVDEIRPLVMLALRIALEAREGRPVTFTVRTKTVRIDPLKLVDLGVHLLRCFAGRLECIAMEAYAKGDGGFGSAYRRVLSRCRPNFALQRFRLPLPRAAMLQRRWLENGEISRGKRAVGKDRIAAYMGFLLEKAPEVLRMASNYHAQCYKARDYWVPVDMYGERVVASGADALILAGVADTIRPLVSQYLWKQKLEPTVKKFAEHDSPISRPLAFALHGVRQRIDAATVGLRVQRHIDAGGTFKPVAEHWKPGSPGEIIERVPERLRFAVEKLHIEVNVSRARELAWFVRLEHLEDLRRETEEILDFELVSRFPNAEMLVRVVRESTSGLRVRMQLASEDDLYAISPGAYIDGDAYADVAHDRSTSERRLKRAIARAVRAALRDAIFCRNLHALTDFREFEAPATFSHDPAGAAPPPVNVSAFFLGADHERVR
jgi:hypothetical protein